VASVPVSPNIELQTTLNPPGEIRIERRINQGEMPDLASVEEPRRDAPAHRCTAILSPSCSFSCSIADGG
jgi:hypothetical protein